MKWWIVGAAVLALLLVSASIWLASASGAPMIVASALASASVLLAGLAIFLAILDANRRQLFNRVITLAALLCFGVLVSGLRMASIFDFLGAGPFCSRYHANGSDACAQRAPLVATIYYLAPVFILPIAALLSTFWRRKENTAVMPRPVA